MTASNDADVLTWMVCRFPQGHAPRPGERVRQSPLDLLHSVLQHIASRLLLNQVILDLKHLLAAPSPWAGRIRREATHAFEIGVRYVCTHRLVSSSCRDMHCPSLPGLTIRWVQAALLVGSPLHP